MKVKRDEGFVASAKDAQYHDMERESERERDVRERCVVCVDKMTQR